MQNGKKTEDILFKVAIAVYRDGFFTSGELGRRSKCFIIYPVQDILIRELFAEKVVTSFL